MGFGTLFIGYFMLLNTVAYAYTDMVAGLIMLLGLYKLYSHSSHFKAPMYASIVFSAYGLGLLIFKIIELLNPTMNVDIAVSILGMVRYAIFAILTLLSLRAMRDIGRELDVTGLPLRSRTMMIWTIVFSVARIVFNSASFTNFLPPTVTLILYIVVIIGELALVIFNLAIIYTCYMYICLPSDLKKKGAKPSRFGIVNEFRRRREEREQRDARDLEERHRRLAEKRSKAAEKGGKKKK